MDIRLQEMATTKAELDPASKGANNEQLSRLFHDLNSAWGIISWTIHSLSEEFLAPVDYQLYEDMFERNRTSAQSILIQLLAYLPQQDLITAAMESIDELQAQKSLDGLEQTSLFMTELNKLFN